MKFWLSTWNGQVSLCSALSVPVHSVVMASTVVTEKPFRTRDVSLQVQGIFWLWFVTELVDETQTQL